MSDPFYRTATWRRLRAEALRLQPVCATPGCHAPSVVADHITPRARGGKDTLANLRGLCIRCHNQRRHGGEPAAQGCTPAGTPLDPRHWWNAPAGNLSGLRGPDRVGATPRVSSTRTGKPD